MHGAVSMVSCFPAQTDWPAAACVERSATRLDGARLPLLPGGKASASTGTVAELAYWKLSGGPTPGEARCLTKTDPASLAAEAKDGLAALVAHFNDPATPYRAYPDPARAPRYDDYAHLGRLAEWRAGEPDT